MIFGEKSSRSTSEQEALKMIEYYLAEGGNHLDTADVYAEGRSETIVGKAIKGKRNEVVLSTKIRFPTSKNPNAVGLSRLHLIEGVHASLKRLHTDYIDLLYIHCWDPITPIEETLRTLEDLIRSGKIRYMGISNFKAWQMIKAQGVCTQLNMNTFIAGQYQYSLVKRDIEYEFFDLLESEGIGLLPWGPLGGGFLTGKYGKNGANSGRISTTPKDYEESWDRRNTTRNWDILNQVKKIAIKHKATPTQVAIAWILSKSVVSSVVLGTRTIQQLEDNLGANNILLSKDEIQALDHLSKLPELYPYRMIEAYGNRVL